MCGIWNSVGTARARGICRPLLCPRTESPWKKRPSDRNKAEGCNDIMPTRSSPLVTLVLLSNMCAVYVAACASISAGVYYGNYNCNRRARVERFYVHACTYVRAHMHAHTFLRTCTYTTSRRHSVMHCDVTSKIMVTAISCMFKFQCTRMRTRARDSWFVQVVETT